MQPNPHTGANSVLASVTRSTSAHCENLSRFLFGEPTGDAGHPRPADGRAAEGPDAVRDHDYVMVRARQDGCIPKNRSKRRRGQPRPRRPPAHLQFPDDDLAELQSSLRWSGHAFSEPDWRIRGEDGKLSARQSLPDRIVAYAALLVLGPVFEPYRQFFTAGWRPNVSDFDALDWVKRLMLPADWFIRLDVKSCFESIRHDLVLRQLARLCARDRDLLYLIADLLTSVESAPGRGIGRGTTLSPLLADVAFSAVDDEFARKGVQNTYAPYGAMHPCVPANEQMLPANLLAPCHLPDSAPEPPVGSYRRLARRNAFGDWVLPATTHHLPATTHADITADYTTTPVLSTHVLCKTPHVLWAIHILCKTPLLPDTHYGILESPVLDYVRCYDDLLFLGVGDRSRVSTATDHAHEVLARAGLPLNPEKEKRGPLSKGFDLVGLHLRLVDGQVEVTMSQDRMERLLDKIDNEIEAQLGSDCRDPGKILHQLRQFAHNGYQFYRQAGANCSVIDRYLDIQFRDHLKHV